MALGEDTAAGIEDRQQPAQNGGVAFAPFAALAPAAKVLLYGRRIHRQRIAIQTLVETAEHSSLHEA